MKKVKWIFWLLVIGFIVLVIYQNQNYFLNKQHLGIDLYFQQYQTPVFANGLLILAVFLVGLLLAYVFTLSERFKSGRTIRSLKESIADHLEQIALLKREVESIKASSVKTAEPVREEEVEAPSMPEMPPARAEESPSMAEEEAAVPEVKENQE